MKRSNIFLDIQVDASWITLSRACEAAGFRLADTRVQLSRQGTPDVRHPALGRLRAARAEDRDAVAGLAARSLRGSRFHQDPFIASELADGLKAAWAVNYFTGRRGDGMVVADTEEGVAGFLLFLRRNGTMVIDLIAVDAAVRGAGLGTGLVAFACGEARLQSLSVGTQAGNTTSLRFYQSLGFRVERICHVFHHHGLLPRSLSAGSA